MVRISASSLLLTSILVIFSPICTASEQTNLLQGDIRHVHDPVIIKQGDTYYLFSTGKGIPVRQSKDLVHWKYTGEVFDEIPAWARESVPGTRDFWAPDISFWNGKYHLYYSVSIFGKNTSCIGLATNKTLDSSDSEYRWVDEGKVIQSVPGRDDWNAIDPNLAFDEQSVPWLAFGSFWSGIKLVRLDPQTGKRDPAHPELYPLARRFGTTAIEASFIIRKQDHYFLFVSFDQCCKGVNSTYKTFVGRADQITGPYFDRTGRPMLEGGGTLMLAGHGRWRGPGHNAVLTEGDTDWLVHHAYDAEAGGVSTLQIRPLRWADDGWPLPGQPLAGARSQVAEVSPEHIAGSWNHSLNFQQPSTIRLLAGGKIDREDGPNTWSVEGSTLLLQWPRDDAPGGVWIDRCLLSPDATHYVGRNQNDMLIWGEKQEPQTHDQKWIK